jgi:hypothetical protein
MNLICSLSFPYLISAIVYVAALGTHGTRHTVGTILLSPKDYKMSATGNSLKSQKLSPSVVLEVDYDRRRARDQKMVGFISAHLSSESTF